MRAALLVLGLATPCLILSYYVGRPWRWFSWHPLLEMIAFIAAGSSGILVKRKGGRQNTISHGYAMVAALLLAMTGWYIIYEQKKMVCHRILSASQSSRVHTC